MTRSRLVVLIGLLSGATLAAAASSTTVRPTTSDFRPPPTRSDTVVDTLYGTPVPDPYRWLENGSSPEVIAWANAQDSTARAYLGRLPHRAELAARIKELSYIESISSPVRCGSRLFYKRRDPNQEKAVLYWRDVKSRREHVLLDPNTWSADGNWALISWTPSPDGARVAFTRSRNVMDQTTLHIVDVASGARSKIDVIEGARYAYPSWTPDGKGFYYTWIPTDSTIPPAQVPGYQEVRFHKLGEDPRRDRIVIGRTGDPSVFPGGEVSLDGHWFLLTIFKGWSHSEIYFCDLRNGRADSSRLRPLAVGREARYNVTAWKDQFYIHTNDEAPRWRVIKVDPAHPEREHWTEVVPEGAETIDKMYIAGDHLVLAYLKDATSRIQLRRMDGKGPRDVALPAIGTVDELSCREDQERAYFRFDSFTTPPEVHELSITTGKSTLWRRPKVPIDPSAFVVEQEFYPSKDGTRIPMFLVHGKTFRKDGTTPALLTGYGGFQVAMTPYFSPRSYVWLERGGILAVACLRGGNEYGEEWHRAGMLLNKQNVFDDFIAGAEYLIRERYTDARRLTISGGSNGGLLVGAALTQRPELFRAVLCSQPLLDMVRYHKFGSGSTWTSEYGSAEDPEQFRAIYAYSPYHHVRKGTAYPAVLVLSPENDDRVDPMHARKFAAALQSATTDGPVLLRIEREASHRGPDRVRSAVESAADSYAFLLDQVGDGAP